MARHTTFLFAALFASAALTFGAARPGLAAPHPDTPPAWDQMGLDPWPGGMMGGSPMGGGMMSSGMMGVSLPRHRYAMSNGIPAPYSGMQNPLPRTRATVDRGRLVYERNCAACHGESGAGDGPAAKTLSPRPAYLALLAQMPIVQWDAFMYWTVAEGGTKFGSAMPAFKATLSKDDTWAVIAYIQAHLPRKAK